MRVEGRSWWKEELPTDAEYKEATANLKKHNCAVANEFSQAVQTAAKYHDIGKLFTKRFENRRGERTQTAHFYRHENYSAYLYLTQMCCGKELSKDEFEEILYVTNLINCHMRPLNIWRNNDKAKGKDKTLFGEKFFADLVNLNKCDLAAH